MSRNRKFGGLTWSDLNRICAEHRAHELSQRDYISPLSIDFQEMSDLRNDPEVWMYMDEPFQSGGPFNLNGVEVRVK